LGKCSGSEKQAQREQGRLHRRVSNTDESEGASADHDLADVALPA